MDTAIIKTENLTKVFGKKKIISNINLAIKRGTIFGYLGPNGAGKTTTIRILLGLLSPTQGQSTIFGQNSEKMTPEFRARIGVVLDDHGLYENLTVHQNLEYYGRIFRLPAAVRNTRISECLENVDMLNYKNEKIKHFSKGMKQRISLARCLLNNPEIIFLDEPTSGLDPDSSVRIRELLRELVNNQRATIFLNSHDLDGVEKLANEIAILKEGEIIAQGSIPELQKRLNKIAIEIRFVEMVDLSGIEYKILNLPYVKGINSVTSTSLVIEISNTDFQTEIIRTCIELGLKVIEVRQSKSSLEDVYLSIVKDDENNT